uniref:Polyprotein protein n=1 Tax=Solanum tuberosum TaxID=4113 RepID=M1D9C6_SOLTU
MSMIFEAVENPDIPADTDVPLTTTENEVQVKKVVAEDSKDQTAEEHLGVDEEASYEGLTKIEKAMVDSAIQISLANTTIVGSIVTATPSATVQDQRVAPGSDAPTDGATV